MNTWKAYERLVARLTADQYASDHRYTVIPNASITGLISGDKRQIDVLVEYRYDSDLSKRVVIDAKMRKRPIDIKEVESFEGFMKDVGASRGILVCANGHTAAAKRRALQHIAITLLSVEELETFDINSWEPCRDPRFSTGLVMWDANPGIIVDGIVTVQAIGKCDECGMFQVWCWGCGNKKALRREVDWQCACKGPWFWLTAIEEDDDTDPPALVNYLLLVLGNGQHQIVDRRPL